MKASSIFLNMSVALFLVLVNQVDENEAIFIPIIKPDLRFLAEKKKQLLSFVNVPAVLQILGQIINLNAIMQHFGLAPPAAPGATAGHQRGSGSANKATVVPPPTSTEVLEPDCDDSTTAIPDEGSQESRNIPTVQDSSQETITEPSSSNEGSQEREVVQDGREKSAEKDEEIPTRGSEELKTTDGNGIEVEFRRRKLESLRRRYLSNALDRLRKI